MAGREQKPGLLETSRRAFLSGMGALAGGLPLNALGREHDTAVDGVHRPRQRVFQGMAYVSFDGTGDSFDNPRMNHATRDYLNSLSREEYLRRHGFL